MKKNDLLFLLASATFLAVAWVVFSLLHISFTSTINSTTQQQILPIQPKFNTTSIDTLKKRSQIQPVFTATNFSSTSSTPTPPANIVLPIAPIASSSTQVATPGGTQ